MTSIRVAGFPTRIEQRNIRKLYASRGNGNSIVWNSDGAKRTVTLSGPWAFNVRLSEEGKVEDRETGQMEYAMPWVNTFSSSKPLGTNRPPFYIGTK